MVIILGNRDTVMRVQILDETVCILRSTNAPGKGMNPIIFPPAMRKLSGRLCSLTVL